MRSVAQSALDRRAPAAPFALAALSFELWQETALALPRAREARRVRAQPRHGTRKVGGAERGGLHHGGTIDWRSEDIGDELHGDVACGHAAVNAKNGAACRSRPIGAHRLEQISGLIADCLER